MMRHLLAMLAAMALVTAACTGSATVTQTDTVTEAQTDTTRTPTSASTPEATSTAPGSSPDASDDTDTAPEPTPGPIAPPAVVLAADELRTDNLVGLSSNGAFAYAGTSSPWNTPTSCDADTAEALSVVEVVAAEAGDLMVLAAGLEQAGDVRQMVFHADGSAALLSSCERAAADPDLWLQRVAFGSDGRIVSVGERVDMRASNESEPYLLQWIDDEVVEVRVVIQQDPDDVETWRVERRQLNTRTGQVVASEQFNLYDDEGFVVGAELTTEDGTYGAVDDPAGGRGCEGFGVAVTLQLDTGGDQQLALTQPSLVFSDVADLHVSPAGYISWTSGCEGYVSAYVGRVQADGKIADAHLIETFSFLADSYAEFLYYRLTSDGFLHGVGRSFDPDLDDPTPEFLRYDLSADPHFVNTADPAPQINPEPLFEAVAEGASWHVGDTLARDAACGGRTLYGQTPGGFVRAFPAGFEIDTIVDVDFGETRRIGPVGGDFVHRTVVVQTECPSSYEGRRVWFGLETDQVVWGLGLDQADLGEVADVLAVRDVLRDDTDFVETSIVQVELLDGSVAEVELVRLPREG